MLNVTRRCLGASAWPAVALFLMIPNLAQAQLFPDRTIRRQRPPCTTETPFNAQVRRDYFGYYPTCWSRFPAGWQCPCPNPELPNLAASIREHGEFGSKKPLSDRDPAPGMGDENPDDGAGRGPDAPNLPVPNPGRSPFDLDTNPKTPAPGGDSDAFTSPNAPSPAPPPRPTNPAGRPSAGLMDMPKVPETSPTTSYESSLSPGVDGCCPGRDTDLGQRIEPPPRPRTAPAGARVDPERPDLAGSDVARHAAAHDDRPGPGPAPAEPAEPLVRAEELEQSLID